MNIEGGAAGEVTTEPAAPALRVVRGEPDAAELAALLAVLSAAGGAPQARPEDKPSSWAAYWRSHRRPLHPEVDGWRNSGRPR